VDLGVHPVPAPLEFAANVLETGVEPALKGVERLRLMLHGVYFWNLSRRGPARG
jgi:hypothetical protein